MLYTKPKVILVLEHILRVLPYMGMVANFGRSDLKHIVILMFV